MFHINPKSVDSYLFSICNQLELYFPDVRQHRKSALVNQTLAGAKQYRGTPTQHKSPLTIANHLAPSTLHNNLLFNTLLNTSFTGLLHLSELTWPDKITLRDYKKLMMQHSLQWTKNSYSFWLPTHKANTTFEGNCIVIKKITGAPDSHPIMAQYITS